MRMLYTLTLRSRHAHAIYEHAMLALRSHYTHAARTSGLTNPGWFVARTGQVRDKVYLYAWSLMKNKQEEAERRER